MKRIENVRKIIGMDGSTPVAVLDLQVSTLADLPELGEVVEGYKTAAGSISQVVQAGGFRTLDSTGTWYDESGNAVTS